MTFFSLLIVVLGLSFFETISSIDNAIINAEVLSTLKPKARKWFLLWGMLIAVFLVRGLLPWVIVWAFNPGLGMIGSLTATFSNDPRVLASITESAPILLIAGSVFLIFLFLHWLFLEEKHFGLPRTEKFFMERGVWFYGIASIILIVITSYAINISSAMVLGALIGSSAFFVTQGFKENAEKDERKLMHAPRSDMSKLLYLEIIDATFSIDSVLGAFAFTLSVPLILIGNGLGALVVRKLTMGNIARIKKYIYLKNGAMYSILCLGIVMLLDSFGVHIPEYISPLVTVGVVGFFFMKSHYALKRIPQV